MILRRRFPDGRDLSVDLGPGPVGPGMSKAMRAIGAVGLADAIPFAITHLTTQRTEEQRERQRAYAAKSRGKDRG